MGKIFELTLGSLSSGPQNFIVKFGVLKTLSASVLDFNFSNNSNLAWKFLFKIKIHICIFIIFY